MSDYQLLLDIYKTSRELCSVSATPIDASWREPLLNGQSKFGGIPYLPKEFMYPKSPSGKHMPLLAQINYAEVFSTMTMYGDKAYLEFLPQDGLLQIYIDEDEWDGVKALYIPYQSDHYQNSQDLSFLKDPTPLSYFPIEGGVFKLSFYPSSEPAPRSHPEFDTLFEKYINCSSEKENPSFYDLYCSLIKRPSTHQIGGYPDFVQDPPDFIEDCMDDYIVLLKMGYEWDSFSKMGISFGDAGIANFLILKEDLKNLDFSKVVYYWSS